MLPALIFHWALLLALVLVPSAVIVAVLLLLDHQHGVWRRLARWRDAVHTRLSPAGTSPQPKNRISRAMHFVLARFDTTNAWGLAATVAAIGVLVGLWLFFGLTYDLVHRDPIVGFDLRLHRLMPALRAEGTTMLMLGLTDFASAPVLGCTATAMVLLALAMKRPRIAVAWAAGVVGAAALSLVMKLSFGLARPQHSLLQTHTATFPSGHLLGASTVFGLAALFLMRSRATRAVKIAGTAGLVLLIVGVGLSRLYLGVHWPSDLMGSLALALALVSAISFMVYADVTIPRIDGLAFRHPAQLRLSAVACFGAAIAVAIMRWPSLQAGEPPAPPKLEEIPVESVSAHSPFGLPTYSTTLAGTPMEPVSHVFVGTRTELLRCFQHAGWSLADDATPARVARATLALLKGVEDATAPSVPAFLANEPPALVFERSAVPRRYARLWSTQLCVTPGCRPVWVATMTEGSGDASACLVA